MKINTPGHRLLVRPIDIPDEEVSDGGIVIPKDSQTLKMEKKGAERGTVLQIGPTCWRGAGFNDDHAHWKPWCKVGDEIFFMRYGGREIVDIDTKETLFILNDQDVLCVIQKEENNDR